jgi:hypothetical protein
MAEKRRLVESDVLDADAAVRRDHRRIGLLAGNYQPIEISEDIWVCFAKMALPNAPLDCFIQLIYF